LNPEPRHGGVYWLNDSELADWTRIAGVFETASRPGQTSTTVYSLRVVADEEMVRAVGDSLTAEVEAAIAQMEAELALGNLQERACLTRLKQAGRLNEKVQRYEQAFDSPLTKLREACQRAASAAAMAALQASAAQQPTSVLAGAA
jgi:hypothetical protein